MSSEFTLYTFKMSLWAAAPRVAIHELGLHNVKQVEIDLSKAENFSPSYLKINPNHTVPALEVKDGEKKESFDSTGSVVDYLNSIAGHKLSIPEKQAEIDAFLKAMHEEGDVGNPLFFTSGSPEELESKRGFIVPFIENRIRGWETYTKEAPQYAELYQNNIRASQAALEIYQGIVDPQLMFKQNKGLWESAQQFLDKAENILKSNGDYLFGTYSVADVHFTPYLHRLGLVRKPEQVFENRPALKSYYERVQSRPSFSKTFN
ncbi:hypothetical protein BY458DRAFT_491970 [Sporodiniella umbellata]|nr:hypothetical protein BY458DRAFT_491970 [Sporodiniella umbellata]